MSEYRSEAWGPGEPMWIGMKGHKPKEKIGEIFKLLDALSKHVHNPTEKLCLNAIKKVFESVETLDFLILNYI